jgi:phytoene dehydrogenase-like protein
MTDEEVPMTVRSDDETDVLVVGAGLAGLAAAATAAGAGARVTVIDVRSPGGRARTDRIDGFAFNQGPHALYADGAGSQVLQRLGVEPLGGTPPAAGSGAARAGRVELLPVGVISLLRTHLLSARSRAQAGALLARLPRIDAPTLATTSVNGWFDQLRLGDDVRDVMGALVRVSSYQADHDSFSADAAVGQLQLVLSGGVRYLDGGWQQLVDGLVAVATASGVVVRPGERADAVERADDGFVVRTAARDIRATSVVLACGGPGPTERLVPVDPAWRLVGPDAHMACLDLGLSRMPEHRFVLGIDVPSFFSIHHPPADLAPEGHHVAHVGLYETSDPARDRGLLDQAAWLAGVRADDVVRERFLHRMPVSHACPSPATGGLAGRPSVVVAACPGLFVAGDWVGPVGMLADASLASAEQAGTAAAACTAPRRAAA